MFRLQVLGGLLTLFEVCMPMHTQNWAVFVCVCVYSCSWGPFLWGVLETQSCTRAQRSHSAYLSYCQVMRERERVLCCHCNIPPMETFCFFMCLLVTSPWLYHQMEILQCSLYRLLLTMTHLKSKCIWKKTLFLKLRSICCICLISLMTTVSHLVTFPYT